MTVDNIFNDDLVLETTKKFDGIYQENEIGYTFTFKDFVACLKAHYDTFISSRDVELDVDSPTPSFFTLWQNSFDKGLVNYLIADSARGMFREIEHSISHDSPLITSWNGLVNNSYTNLTEEQKLDKLKPITNLFQQLPYLIFSKLEKEGLENVPIDDVISSYVNLIQKVENGNFHPQLLSTYDYSKCSCCGQSFHLALGLWQGKLQLSNPDKKNKDYPFVDAPYCGNDKIESVTVNFPSGTLYIADWIRIPEFTNAVEYNGEDKYSEKTNINYTAGRIFNIKHYAEKHNFISVNVGNSSPRIFVENNNLVIGHTKSQDETTSSNFKIKGTVCTDLWNTTIIDKETLYQLLEPKMGGEKALEKVNNLVHSSDITEVKVQPGEYTLHFHGNYYDFNSLANKEHKILSEEQQKLLPKDLEKFFVVNPQGVMDLSNSQKKTSKKKM